MFSAMDYQFWSLLPVKGASLKLMVGPDVVPKAIRVEQSRSGKLDEWRLIKPTRTKDSLLYDLGDPQHLSDGGSLSLRGEKGVAIGVNIVENFGSDHPLENIDIRLSGRAIRLSEARSRWEYRSTEKRSSIKGFLPASSERMASTVGHTD